mmetsp:Transcript_7277/g.7437  ORF Transcript_7277/g.7437 Transcript_7277/m.7437 type:complete len:88 (-) Transcript_7277:305-568(-)
MYTLELLSVPVVTMLAESSVRSEACKLGPADRRGRPISGSCLGVFPTQSRHDIYRGSSGGFAHANWRPCACEMWNWITLGTRGVTDV